MSWESKRKQWNSEFKPNIGSRRHSYSPKTRKIEEEKRLPKLSLPEAQKGTFENGSYRGLKSKRMNIHLNLIANNNSVGELSRNPR